LLDSYDSECRPVAGQFVEMSTGMFNAIAALPGVAGFRDAVAKDSTLPRRLSPPDQYKAQFCYEGSPICVSDGTPSLEGKARFTPSARPGTRAPHCWIGEGRSTLDLFGDGFVLLRFGSPGTDVVLLTAAATAQGVPLEIVDIDHAGAAAIYEKPLVLVRPDGHVVWRGDALPGDAAGLINRARGA
jgi:hypothetical protein